MRKKTFARIHLPSFCRRQKMFKPVYLPMMVTVVLMKVMILGLMKWCSLSSLPVKRKDQIGLALAASLGVNRKKTKQLKKAKAALLGNKTTIPFKLQSPHS